MSWILFFRIAVVDCRRDHPVADVEVCNFTSDEGGAGCHSQQEGAEDVELIVEMAGVSERVGFECRLQTWVGETEDDRIDVNVEGHRLFLVGIESVDISVEGEVGVGWSSPARHQVDHHRQIAGV